MYPSWPDFTLLTPCLFNGIAGGVLISMGLHDNMKMSPKLGQNGNSETGGHGAFSEPKPVCEHPQLLQLSLEPPAPWWAMPPRVLQHARITALFFQCILLFPNTQTNPKYVPLPNLMLIAHMHLRVLCLPSTSGSLYKPRQAAIQTVGGGHVTRRVWKHLITWGQVLS